MLVPKMVALQEVITIRSTYRKDNNSECVVRSYNVGIIIMLERWSF